jgi:hypothetical protein
LLKLLRGRYSFLIILAVILSGLVVSFQNCANLKNAPAVASDDGIVNKIEVEPNAGVLSVYDSTEISEQGQNLLEALPNNKPLVVLIRNGPLYPGVQLIINERSYLVSDYLNLLKLFTPENPSVPIFYSPKSLLEYTQEPVHHIQIDFGSEVDNSRYCESMQNLGRNATEGDLIIQIADATPMLQGNLTAVLQVYWTLPLKIFSVAGCIQ